MREKTFRTLLLLVALLAVFAFTACTTNTPATETPQEVETPEEAAPPAEEEPVEEEPVETAEFRVGVVLPTREEPRWIQDEARFRDAFAEAGYEVEILFSEGDSSRELANVQD